MKGIFRLIIRLILDCIYIVKHYSLVLKHNVHDNLLWSNRFLCHL